MTKSALLIIDVQFDFLPGGALAVQNGDEIIPGIIELLKSYKWDAVAVSQDWHPKDHTSFAINHKDAAPFRQLEFTSTKDNTTKSLETVWPVHCVQHTHGANFPEEIVEAYKAIDVPKTVIQKGQLQDRDYYSAFNDIWDDDHTELNSFLKEHGIDEVYLVGLAYDYCVKFSAESAAKLGYKVNVIKSLSKAIATDQIKEIDAYYTKSGVEILENVNVEKLNKLKI